MVEPAQWNKFKPKPEEPTVESARRNYKPIFALIIVVLGTLLLATGMLFAFGVPIFLVSLGFMMVIVGLSLGYSKE